MNGSEYRQFLQQVDALLPQIEAELKGIDLSAFPQLSYANGKFISDQRELALREVEYSRLWVSKQRIKRSISGELALKGFLDSLWGLEGDIIWTEDFTGLHLTHLEMFAPEFGQLQIQIANDVIERVALMEKGVCPQ
jgi:hypothetical protein